MSYAYGWSCGANFLQAQKNVDRNEENIKSCRMQNEALKGIFH